MRRRNLRAFVGRGLLESFEAEEMLAYQHSGFSVNTKLAAQGSSHGYGSKHKVSRFIVEASAVDLGSAPDDVQGIGSDPRFNTRGTAGIGGPMDVDALCDQLDQRRADLR